mmetsp:Transcript_6531/g.19653  ORF Transcript_6531/g.19653 Transcript_6531/m.19653 type:complete len:104 (+) Transcript_6531:309-620(+)
MRILGCTVVNCPCGEQVGGALSLRVQQLNVQCETKTKDNVFVITRIAVQYEVLREDAYNAYYKVLYRSRLREMLTAASASARGALCAPSRGAAPRARVGRLHV